jgi:hypothetical protein
MTIRYSLSLAIVLTATTAVGTEPVQRNTPKKPALDVGKFRVEAPTKDLVKRTAPRDRTKRVVELPTKRIVQVASPASARPQANKSDNPRVSPGKVRWAGDYAAALAASKKSGKPVLLFQLLGQLDHKFT